LFSFLKSRHVQILTVLLLAQAALYYGRARAPERVPLVKELDEFPRQVEEWQFWREGVVDPEAVDVLKADDVLNRFYTRPGASGPTNLFVAYFKSQRRGVRPHSPKNCLPGSGWTPTTSTIAAIQVPGMSAPIEVNRYIVEKGPAKQVVLYWYQSHGRVIASEYRALLYSVLDSARSNRTDTAMVRIVVPVLEGEVAAADKEATEFVRSAFPSLVTYFPS
jgi:EpsI family protein